LTKDEDKPKTIASIPGSRSPRQSRVSTEPSYNEVESKMNEVQESKRKERAKKFEGVFGD
jgi:hypothetical protein